MPRSIHAEGRVRNDLCIVLTGECAGCRRSGAQGERGEWLSSQPSQDAADGGDGGILALGREDGSRVARMPTSQNRDPSDRLRGTRFGGGLDVGHPPHSSVSVVFRHWSYDIS
jgi:hypothetical protein